MDPNTEIVTLKLQDGTAIKVEATSAGGWEDTADFEKVLPMDDLLKTIESLSQALSDTLTRVKPDKASVEFGIQIGVEAGALSALLVKGTGSANLKIGLEWGG